MKCIIHIFKSYLLLSCKINTFYHGAQTFYIHCNDNNYSIIKYFKLDYKPELHTLNLEKQR